MARPHLAAATRSAAVETPGWMILASPKNRAAARDAKKKNPILLSSPLLCLCLSHLSVHQKKSGFLGSAATGSVSFK
uniref:Uncharacterized protein n=1 Tax=Oryza meridionalis TaxID=40149 RepID=A0A0E0E5G6_9ORYZ